MGDIIARNRYADASAASKCDVTTFEACSHALSIGPLACARRILLNAQVAVLNVYAVTHGLRSNGGVDDGEGIGQCFW